MSAREDASETVEDADEDGGDGADDGLEAGRDELCEGDRVNRCSGVRGGVSFVLTWNSPMIALPIAAKIEAMAEQTQPCGREGRRSAQGHVSGAIVAEGFRKAGRAVAGD